MDPFKHDEFYKAIIEKLGDRQEVEQEEFLKLVADIEITGSWPRDIVFPDCLRLYGWRPEKRVENGIDKYYYVKKYDITPEGYHKAIDDYYESHRINREQ